LGVSYSKSVFLARYISNFQKIKYLSQKFRVNQSKTTDLIIIIMIIIKIIMIIIIIITIIIITN